MPARHWRKASPAARLDRSSAWHCVEPEPPHIIGGTETRLYDAEVHLACAGFEWDATVSFCTPDFAGFGLAGLRGFFDKIYVGIDGYVQLVELEPHDDRLTRLGLDSTGGPYR